MTLKKFVRPGGELSVEAPKFGAPRIELLYVEDETVNWEVTELHLKERYRLTRATDAKEAFEMLRSRPFHVVLMDIQLANSELNGIEITQVIRGRFEGIKPPYARDFPASEVPIVFMTAYSARYSKSELLSKGGDELIFKPVDFTHLAIAISKMLLKPITTAKAR